MRRSRAVTVAGAVAFSAFLALPAAAQAPKAEDLKAAVPELEAMHDVIRPLWHEAWPAKDAKAMAALLPDIERHAAAVANAVLPGILRDKQAAWLAKVTDLKAAVASYKAAVGSGDHEALFKAAEKVHAEYEGLVKIVRPVLKEMEEFHAALYVLYHHQLSPFQMAKVSESVGILKLKMDALNTAVLPARLSAKADAFGLQRARLSKAVDDLVAAVAGRDEVKVRAAIEQMHAEYENLERVF
ncbi:MAG TPA: hypothetical protein PLN93_08495 [Vicinamibacterales bacterium]|nr:hypothetical protein [Vicinamibacterales bacterium]